MKHGIALLLAASLCTGCAWIDDLNQPESKAEFEFSSIENLPESYTCVTESFPMTLTDFDLDALVENTVQMEMYDNISKPIFTNYLTLILAETNAETLEPCPKIGSTEGMHLDIHPNGCARVYVQINTCSKAITAQLTGTLELTAFSSNRKGRIEGRLSGQLQDIQKIQTSAGNWQEITTDLGHMQGQFAFTNHAGAVWYP